MKYLLLLIAASVAYGADSDSLHAAAKKYLEECIAFANTVPLPAAPRPTMTYDQARKLDSRENARREIDKIEAWGRHFALYKLISVATTPCQYSVKSKDAARLGAMGSEILQAAGRIIDESASDSSRKMLGSR
jgi:hypothetical protein